MKLKLVLCLVMSMSAHAALQKTSVQFLGRTLPKTTGFKINRYPFKSFTEIPGTNHAPCWNFEHYEVIDQVTGRNYSNEGLLIVAYTSGWMGFEKIQWYSLVNAQRKSFASQEEKRLFFERKFSKGHSAHQDFNVILKELLEYSSLTKKEDSQ